MDWDPTFIAAMRAIHLVAAAFWFGGGIFQVLMIGPTLMQAGPAAGGFIMTLCRRGGLGKFFAIAGGVTILAGGITYGDYVKTHASGAMDFHSGFGLITIGATLAVLAYLHGLMSNMPTERKLIALVKSIQGAPTPEQAKQMGELGGKLGKHSAISIAMVAVALLCMVLAHVVAALNA